MIGMTPVETGEPHGSADQGSALGGSQEGGGNASAQRREEGRPGCEAIGLANISNSALGRSLRILAGLLPCVALTRCRRLLGCLRALSLGLRSHVVLLSLPGSSRSYLPGSSRSYPR